MSQRRAKHHPKLGSTDVRYNGRTVRLDVFINTDDSLEEVAERVKRAAQGPKFNMVIVGAGFVEDKDVIGKLWTSVADAVKKQVDSDN